MSGNPEPTDGPTIPAQTGLITGLEFVTLLSTGGFPRPPMAETLPFTLLLPGEGKVELRAAPERRFLNTLKTAHEDGS
jgi:hypothetical protein